MIDYNIKVGNKLLCKKSLRDWYVKDKYYIVYRTVKNLGVDILDVENINRGFFYIQRNSSLVLNDYFWVGNELRIKKLKKLKRNEQRTTKSN